MGFKSLWSIQTSKLCSKNCVFSFSNLISLIFLTRNSWIANEYVRRLQKNTLKRKIKLLLLGQFIVLFSGSLRFLHNFRINPNSKKWQTCFCFFFSNYFWKSVLKTEVENRKYLIKFVATFRCLTPYTWKKKL